MTVKASKPRYTIHDHLTAYLVLLVIVIAMALGAVGLYMTGIFDPVTPGAALEDTEMWTLRTPKPQAFINWLFPSALAEAPPVEPQAQQNEVLIPATTARPEDELSQLLESIVAEERGEAEVAEGDRVTVDKADLAINRNLPDNVYNALLLATDSRDGDMRNGRSDVMIIASVNKTTNEVKLASLSRDLYVQLSPGIGNNKLNAAYAFGGPYLSVKVVNQVFEMNIEDYVVVNFATMAAIVDALGGVDIHLVGMEYAYINYLVAVSEDYEGFAKSSGRRQLTEEHADTAVHLDGLQAVSYARIRKMDDDLQRGSRQRILLQAMMDKAMNNLSPSTFYSLATSMMNSTSTNVKLTTVIELGNWLLSADEITMNEMSIPVAGSYHSTREKEMDVISFNQSQNVQELHQFIYGEYIPAAQ